MIDALDAAFTAYDLTSRVSTLAKARSEAAYKAASIAAFEYSVAHKAEVIAAEAIYDIAQELRK